MLETKQLLDYFPEMPQVSANWIKERIGTALECSRANPYFFKNNNSSVLLVTLGDSWTWGMELSGYNDFSFVNEADWVVNDGIISNINTARLTGVFGNVLSSIINSDWLNLSLAGIGNFQVADLVRYLGKVIPKLEYKQIYIVCTFTEIGRWFNTKEDNFLDHNKLISSVEVSQDPNQLLAELNRIAIKEIATVLDNFKNVKLLVGTNFVDPIGFENLQSNQILETPWYQLLDMYYEFPSYAISDYSIGNFARSMNDGLIPKHLHPIFDPWLRKIIIRSTKFYDQVAQSPYFPSNTHHPNSKGHTLWAEYVARHII